MQNPIQKLSQSSIVFLSEKLKSPRTTGFNFFHWNFAHISDITMPTKEFSGFFFLFCLDIELFAKIKKELVSRHSQGFFKIY